MCSLFGHGNALFHLIVFIYFFSLSRYLSESWGLNNKYAFGYLGCEALNFANVLGQMFLMDRFLGGFFMDYGTKVTVFAGFF